MSENQFPGRPPTYDEPPGGGRGLPPSGISPRQPRAGQPAPWPPAGAPGWPAGAAHGPARRPADLLDAKGRRIWRLPAMRVDYQHVLRGRGHTWWKPLVAIVFLAVTFLVAQILLGLLLVPTVLLLGDVEALSSAFLEVDFNNPWVMLLGLVSLAVLIPLSMAAVRLVFGVKAGYLSSVVGRFRWRWAAQVTAVVLPLWIVYLALTTAIGGAVTGEGFEIAPPEDWWRIVLMIVLLVPLQAAGEEYAFRGFVLQVVGSWFRSRWLALVVPGIVSVAVFALAHGSLDPVILLDLGAFAALAIYLTWRTGGLEAAVVVHTVNNVLVFLLSTAAGDLTQSLVGEETTMSWVTLGPSLLLDLAAAGLVTVLARRVEPQRSYEPQPLPPPAPRPVLAAPPPRGPAGHAPHRHWGPAQPWQAHPGAPHRHRGPAQPWQAHDRGVPVGDRRAGGDTARFPFPSAPDQTSRDSWESADPRDSREPRTEGKTRDRHE